MSAVGAGMNLTSNLKFTENDTDAHPFESVDVYTKQCSVGVNVAQLARMGATLANNGKTPKTGEQVIKAEYVPT